jgi:DnaJ-class molecular chaperone
VRIISVILISGCFILFSACSHTEQSLSDEMRTCPVCLGSGFMRQYISHDSESSSATYHGGDGITPCTKCGGKRIIEKPGK